MLYYSHDLHTHVMFSKHTIKSTTTVVFAKINMLIIVFRIFLFLIGRDFSLLRYNML